MLTSTFRSQFQEPHQIVDSRQENLINKNPFLLNLASTTKANQKITR